MHSEAKEALLLSSLHTYTIKKKKTSTVRAVVDGVVVPDNRCGLWKASVCVSWGKTSVVFSPERVYLPREVNLWGYKFVAPLLSGKTSIQSLEVLLSLRELCGVITNVSGFSVILYRKKPVQFGGNTFVLRDGVVIKGEYPAILGTGRVGGWTPWRDMWLTLRVLSRGQPADQFLELLGVKKE